MKLNGFGDMVFESTDSPSDFLAWVEDCGHGRPDAAVVSDNGDGWDISIQTTDAPGYVGSATGFATKADALGWVIAVGVPEADIEIEDGEE